MAQERARESLRRIPSMETLLGDTRIATLVTSWGREPVKEAIREHLDALRSGGAAFSLDELAASVTFALGRSMRTTLTRVINATGVLIHTNLGRSPVSAEAWSGASELVSGYSNLEFDLATGARGKRHLHVSDLASRLFGCEAALLVNNNAAAVLLVLSAIAAGKEVIVSRSELVEIGGAFRVPDIIQQGGAKLREVGTTNRTRAADFEAAIGRRTGAILSVHQSNFQIIGFTEEPELVELARVAKAKKVPLVIDEGSGRVADLARYGFRRQPTVRELLAMGADIVTCSTDKLIGASQGGLILGRRELLERCAAHPLMRAIRPGKETFAIVGDALAAFLAGHHEEKIPIYRLLAASIDSLRERARRIADATGARVVACQSALGGGTTPAETIPSVAIAPAGDASRIQRALLGRPTPIASRVSEDRLLLDLRSVPPEADGEILAALTDLAGRN
ncbi:MAG: L-seryl-tRNA(Sec) selenium transferase [Thermoanaerobaculia bacterium]|nr:L-seryl-tRNA(Sec) selenium transferase [Thermoanaerobaculia bacterium]